MLCFIVWTICSERYNATKVEANGSAVVAMIFLYYTCYNTAWSGLLVGYTVEILPFSIRAKGMCYMFAFVDIALFFNTYVNPIALEKIGWKYYIVYVSSHQQLRPRLSLTRVLVCLARFRTYFRMVLLHRNSQHSS